MSTTDLAPRGRRMLLSICLVTGIAATVYALDGKNGYGASMLFAAADVQTSTTYPSGFQGVEWSDLNEVRLWAPSGQGERQGLAADASGNLYVLVRGRDSNTGYDPEYTGLVRYDGNGLTQLTQDRMSSGFYASRTGAEIQSVVVSPSSVGLLTQGHPVIVRQIREEKVGTDPRPVWLSVVSVDPSSADETLIWSLLTSNWVSTSARVSIDGTGDSTDGTLYVGPMGDGSIATLTWNGSGYQVNSVPGTFSEHTIHAVGADGDLYLLDTAIGGSKDENPIYRVDPGTGSASTYAWVPGYSLVYDWDFDPAGNLWMGLQGNSRGRKYVDYIAEVIEGTTIDVRDRISEGGVPWSIAAGPSGTMYVLEDPWSSHYGQVWQLSPGSGGGDSGGGGGGKGGGKGKNK